MLPICNQAGYSPSLRLCSGLRRPKGYFKYWGPGVKEADKMHPILEFPAYIIVLIVAAVFIAVNARSVSATQSGLVITEKDN